MNLGMGSRMLIVAIMVSGLLHLASSLTLFDREISIRNSATETLTAVCKSNGDDIGTFTIPYQNNLNFRSNVLVKERSVATCSLTLGNRHGTFDVFDWSRDKDRCDHSDKKICYWVVDQSGISLEIHGNLVFQFNWP